MFKLHGGVVVVGKVNHGRDRIAVADGICGLVGKRGAVKIVLVVVALPVPYVSEAFGEVVGGKCPSFDAVFKRRVEKDDGAGRNGFFHRDGIGSRTGIVFVVFVGLCLDHGLAHGKNRNGARGGVNGGHCLVGRSVSHSRRGGLGERGLGEPFAEGQGNRLRVEGHVGVLLGHSCLGIGDDDGSEVELAGLGGTVRAEVGFRAYRVLDAVGVAGPGNGLVACSLGCDCAHGSRYRGKTRETLLGKVENHFLDVHVSCACDCDCSTCVYAEVAGFVISCCSPPLTGNKCETLVGELKVRVLVEVGNSFVSEL